MNFLPPLKIRVKNPPPENEENEEVWEIPEGYFNPKMNPNLYGNTKKGIQQSLAWANKPPSTPNRPTKPVSPNAPSRKRMTRNNTNKINKMSLGYRKPKHPRTRKNKTRK